MKPRSVVGNVEKLYTYTVYVILPYEDCPNSHKRLAQRVVGCIYTATYAGDNFPYTAEYLDFINSCACNTLDRIFSQWITTPLSVPFSEFESYQLSDKKSCLKDSGYDLFWESCKRSDKPPSSEGNMQILRVVRQSNQT